MHNNGYGHSVILEEQPSAKPRISFVTSWNAKCGIAEYTRYLVDAIGSRAVCTIIADHGADLIRNDDESVVRCWHRRHWTEAEVEEIVSQIVNTQPDVVSIQFPIFHLIGGSTLLRVISLLKRAGIGVSITLHSPWNNPEIVEALRHADAVIAHRLDDLVRLKEHGVPYSFRQPQGIARFDGVRGVADAKAPCNDGIFTIGTFGFFMPHKGIFEILAAFRWALRVNPGLRLRILSSMYPQPALRPYVAFCIDWMRAQGLSSRVHLWTEFMEERQIVTRLSECDLVVLAYTHTQEASSAAIRMPLASMTPVLCSDLPIFDEFSEAVHRFPAGNTVELAQIILTLASDRELLTSKAKAHADLVASMSWEKIAGKFLQIVVEENRTPDGRTLADQATVQN